MIKSKFKVGDIVEVISNNNSHNFLIGEKIKITYVCENTALFMAEDLDKKDWWWVLGRDIKQIDEEKINRKEYPVYTGFIKYFPDAILEISHLSFLCNEQHNPGTEVHWDRTKSKDEPDAMMRHLIDEARGIKLDEDNIRHLTKVAWRALSNLQKEIENDNIRKA